MAIKTELRQYLAMVGNTQVRLAKSVGVTQGAIFQMLKSNRRIVVVEQDDGSLLLEETRQVAPKTAA